MFFALAAWIGLVTFDGLGCLFLPIVNLHFSGHPVHLASFDGPVCSF
jgi:hypothetical protein